MKKRFFTLFLAASMVMTSMPPIQAKAADNPDTLIEEPVSDSTYKELGLDTAEPDEYKDTWAAPYGNGSGSLNAAMEVAVGATHVEMSGQIYTDGTAVYKSSLNVYDDNIKSSYGNIGKKTDIGGAEPKLPTFTVNFNYSMMPRLNLIQVASVDASGDGIDDYLVRYHVYGESPYIGSDRSIRASLEITDPNTGEMLGTFPVSDSPLDSCHSSEEFSNLVKKYRTRKFLNLNQLFPVAAGDFDGDGKDEVAMRTSNSVVKVFDITGDGKLSSQPGNIITLRDCREYCPMTLYAGDINKNGADELVIGYGDQVSIYETSVVQKDREAQYGGLAGIESQYHKKLKPIIVQMPSGLNETIDVEMIWDNLSAIYADIDGNGREELVIAYGGYRKDLGIGEGALFIGKYAYNAEVYNYTGDIYTGNNEYFASEPFAVDHDIQYDTEEYKDEWEDNTNRVNSINRPVPLAAARIGNSGDGPVSKDTLWIVDRLYQFQQTPNEDGTVPGFNKIDAGGYLFPNDNEPGIHYAPRKVAQVISGNFDGNEKQNEGFRYLWGAAWEDDDDGSAKERAHWEIGAFNSLDQQPWTLYSKSQSDTFCQGVSLCAGNFDYDSSIVEYQGRELTFTDPKVLAVLASTPYFEEHNLLEDGFASNGSTSYGTSSGSSTTNSGSVSVSAGAYAGYEYEFKEWITQNTIAKVETEVSTTFSTNTTFSDTKSQEYSIDYASNGGEDSVALISIPEVIYRYRTRVPLDPDCPEFEMSEDGYSEPFDVSVVVPMAPVKSVVPAETYQKVADKTEGLPDVYGKNGVLVHTVGDPATYKYADRFNRDKWTAEEYVRNNVGSSSISQTLAKSSEHENGVETGFSLETKIGGGAGGFVAGATIGFESGYGWATVKSEGESISGTVMNMPRGAENYGFEWKLGGYKQDYKTDYMDKSESFIVASYDVRNVVAPPHTPVSVEASDIGMTSCELSWEDMVTDASNLPSKYAVLMTADTFGEFETEVYGVYARNPQGDRQTAHIEGMLPGEEYRFQVVSMAMADTDYRKGSIPSEEVVVRTRNSEAAPVIIKQPEDVYAAPGDRAEFSIEVAGAEGAIRSIYYRWQKKEADGSWRNISNTSTTSKMVIEDVTEDMNGSQYRCQVSQVVDGVNLVLLSDIAVLHVVKNSTELSVNVNGGEMMPEIVDNQVKFDVEIAVATQDNTAATGKIYVKTDYMPNGGSVRKQETFAGTLDHDGTVTIPVTVGNSDKNALETDLEIMVEYPGDARYSPAVSEIYHLYPVQKDGSAAKRQYFTMNKVPASMTYGDSVKLDAKIVTIENGTVTEGSDNVTLTCGNGLNYDKTTGLLTTTDFAEGQTEAAITVEAVLDGQRDPVKSEYTIELQKRKAEITVGSLSSQMDEALKPVEEAAVTVKNLAARDSEEDLKQTVVLECSASLDQGVGTYPITVKEIGSTYRNNYDFTVIPGVYEIISVSRKILFEQPFDGSLTAVYQAAEGTGWQKLESGESVPYLARVTFTAEPDELYTVTGWKVNGAAYEENGQTVTGRTITLTADTKEKEIVVEAELGRYTSELSYRVQGEGGTLTAAAAGGDAIEENPVRLSPGLAVIMTAVPEDGWQVKQWKVNGQVYKKEGSSQTYKGEQLNLGKMTEDKDVTVEFELITETPRYAVTYDVVTEDGMTYDESLLTVYENGAKTDESYVSAGSDVKFEMKESSYYDILYWLVDGTRVKPNPITSYTVKAIEKAVDVKVIVAPTMGTRTVSFGVEGTADPGFKVSASSGGKELADGDAVPYGQKVTFTLKTPDNWGEKYQLMGWKVSGSEPAEAGSLTYTIDSLKKDTTVTYVVSAYEFYTINYKTEGTADGDVIELTAVSGGNPVADGDRVRKGSDLVLKASMSDAQREKYEVEGWKSGETVVEAGSEYRKNSVEEDVNLTYTVKPVAIHYVNVTTAATGAGADGCDFRVIRNGKEIEPEADGRYAVYENADWQIEALSDTGWQVAGWKIGGELTETSDSVYHRSGIPEDMEIVIVFGRYTNKITYQKHAAEGDITAWCMGEELVSGDQPAAGSVVTFTAEPANGYEVSDWKVNGAAQNAPGETFELTVSGAAKVEAVWVRTAFELTYEAGPNGALYGDYDTGSLLEKDSEVVLTAEPEAGYEVLAWYVNGKKQSGNRPQLTVTMNGDTSVRVVFAKVKLIDVTISQPSHGTIRAWISGTDQEVLNGDKIERGLSLTVKAEADPGYVLSRWLGMAKDEAPIYTTIELKNVMEDAVLSAEFIPARICDVSFDTKGNGELTVEADGEEIEMTEGFPAQLDSGKELTFTARPDEGYMVDSWIINGETQKELSNTLVITLVKTIKVEVVYRKLEVHRVIVEEGRTSVGKKVWPADWTMEDTIRDGGSLYFEIAAPTDGSYLRSVILTHNGKETVIPVEELEIKDNVGLFTMAEERRFTAPSLASGSNAAKDSSKAGRIATGSNAEYGGIPEKETRMIYRTAAVEEPVIYVLKLEHITGDVKLVVDCARKYTVSFEASEGGKVKILADGKEVHSGDLVYEGSKIEYIITPKEGYKISEVTGAGVVSEDSASLVVEKLHEDVAVKVTFEKISGNGNGNGSSGNGSGSGGGGGSRKISAATNTPGQWILNEKGWWFKNPDGSWPFAAWKELTWNGVKSWYYFDAEGYMATGWFKDADGSLYYLHPIADGTRGHMYTGWHQIDGKWYYFSQAAGGPIGALQRNTVTPDGYTVNSDGEWVQ